MKEPVCGYAVPVVFDVGVFQIEGLHVGDPPRGAHNAVEALGVALRPFDLSLHRKALPFFRYRFYIHIERERDPLVFVCLHQTADKFGIEAL